MNILVHGTILGYGGIAHQTREFTKTLSKYHNVKIRNFNLVDLKSWNGYTGPDILKDAVHLEDAHHKMLYQQTLWDGELKDFPLSGYDSSFVPDIHIIMSETNHYYHYQNYNKPVIVYFLWETTHISPNFLNVLNSVENIWVPSKWQLDVLVNNGINPNKIDIVNLGVDQKKYFPIKKKNEKLRLLHIGTWGYRKSTYEIIKTFSDIFGDDDTVELRLAIHNKLDKQDGPIETFEKFGLPLNNNIKFLNTLSEEDYIYEIQNADIYLSCSRGEGWNLPLIQSIACGVPSVYSKCGGQLEFTKNNLGIGVDIIGESSAKQKLNINGNDYYWDSLPDYSPNNLYEPNFPQFKQVVKSFYDDFKNKNTSIPVEKLLTESNYIHKNFNWDYIVKNANTILEKNKNKNMSNIYHLIHSTSFGDTLASTPTVRYLSKSHGQKINVVTHKKDVFKNNPHVQNILSFDEFDNLNLSNVIKYESHTFAGQKDGNGIEKKFSHMDVRQIHAIDLGFQLPNEDLEYDFNPDPLSLDIELPEKYVVLHVTTNWPNRTWAYDNWVGLIKWLKENNIFTVLVGAGYKESLHRSYSDGSLVKDCPMFDDYYGLDLTNQGSMGDMWWVINGSQCIITMDSGPLHLASCTDTHIIQLGSAINPAFKRFYRNGDWKHKYHFLGGSCQLFCNTNLLYNVREWGDINSVPPQPNCLENKPTFECHPQLNNVIDKLKEIVQIKNDKNYLSFFEFLPQTSDDKINFNFTKTTNDIVNIVVKDVTTGLIRDKYTNTCTRLNDGNYWWTPMPGKIKNLGDIDLLFYLNGIYFGEKRLHFDGNNDLIINGNKFYFDFNTRHDYPTFWEIFINKDYDKIDECKISNNDVVLDIGGNCGFFALYSIQNGASKVYSVEPVKTSFEQIVKLSNNFPEIIPINKAVSETNGTVIMSVDEEGSATNCVTHYSEMFGGNSNKEIVDSININDLLLNIKEKINFMKVDCEGSEFELFKTISDDNLKKIDKIIVEVHGDVIEKFVSDRLIQSGFKLYKHNNILYLINLN
jgi:FkbM family methyltransferase